MKRFDLVKLRSDILPHYKGIFESGDQFVFLGEINQMPGHGVFVMIGNNKVYVGYHIDSFELVPQGF